MGRTIGIDLGTTNSVVAYVFQDRVETIPNSEGSKLTPSVVLFADGEIVVGELAKRQSVTQAGAVIRSAKRLMGRRYSEVEDVLEDFPFEVVRGQDDRAEIKLADGRVIPPEVVAAQVLTKMVLTAEDYMNDEVDAAVITVPAYFNDAQRTATKHAAEIAGLNVLRIINEPTAAALAYGFNARNESQRIAIFDFGGGTFDVSILQLQGDIFEVLSTNGNTQLGGDNIDLKLFQEISDAILQQTGIDPTQDRKAVARIREAAEKTKIELSSLTSTRVSLPFVVADSTGPKHFEWDITREQFESWMIPIFEALFEPCRAALADAHLSAREVNEIILVGGSTRIPKVQEMAKRFFGKEGNRTINPDEAIAIGAAIQAGVMRGELAEILLLDVTPLSLGIELAGGIFKPLIERNSSIPCEATRKFTTVVDNQTAVSVHVLQGERMKAGENRSLGRFRLSGIPPMPKELPEIEVSFRIDADGILEVSAIDLVSGISTGIHIEGYGEFAAMSDAELKALLEDKEAHVREDEEFVRSANMRAQADRVQERLGRVIEDAADVISEEDLRRMKETMLRHDLAVVAKDWNRASHLETALVELVEKYEGMADMHRALNRKLPMAEMPAEQPPARRRAAPEPVQDEPVVKQARKSSGGGVKKIVPVKPTAKKQPSPLPSLPSEDAIAEEMLSLPTHGEDVDHRNSQESLPLQNLDSDSHGEKKGKGKPRSLAKNEGRLAADTEDDYDLEGAPPPPPPPV